MPIYGYRCASCQGEFETVQRMSDPPQAACPDCGGAGTRLFYPAGILFKGSGFYKTDSRASASAATPAATSDASPTPPASGSPSAPATPAKTTTTPAQAPAAPAARPGGSTPSAPASKD